MVETIKQHYKYMDDINKPLDPLPRPQSVNVVGKVPLPPISSIYGF
jgi:hypothetical protein